MTLTEVAGPTAWRLSTTTLLAGIRAEERRLGETLGLAAFENVLSDTARSLMSGPLADRYLLGSAEQRAGADPVVNAGLLTPGYPLVDTLEGAAQQAARHCLGARWVDFRPLSGLHATICTVATLTAPGDRVYSFAPADGGHFATAPLAHALGRTSGVIPWDRAEGGIDLPAFTAAWRAKPGRMLFLDHGAPLAPLPVAELRTVVGPDVRIVYDASHTLGLIFGGVFQDPLAEGCDVVQGNTHKSFPGAHKGMIAFADETLGRQASAAIGSRLVSSQNTGATLANYITTLEMAAFGREYARMMVANQRAFATRLQQRGAVVRPAGRDSPTGDTHVLLLESMGGRGGYELAADLMRAGIRLNARPVGGQVVIRMGVQEVTRRGLTPGEMTDLAELIGDIATGGPRGSAPQRISALAASLRNIHYSFDQDALAA